MDLLSSLPPRDCKHPEIGLENRALVPSPLLIARETYNPLLLLFIERQSRPEGNPGENISSISSLSRAVETNQAGTTSQ